jgi:glycogen(starch) synthase
MHVPVVAARSAGVLDVVVDGETGLFFTPGDSKGLADAIACLVSDGELCRRLANQARRRVEDTFSIDSVVTALLDEYEAAIRPAVAPVTTV